jgi:serine/threonine-protein kinase
MSPEQVQGGRLTSQSDLFSAGIVALELFSEKNPFLGDDVNKTISNLINYNEDTVEAYLISLPEELQSIIRKLLSKRPDRRYKTAEEVLRDLDVPLSSIKINPFAFLKKQKYWAAASVVIVLLTAAVTLSLFNKKEPSETNLASDTPAQIEKSDGDNSTPPEQLSDNVTEESPVINLGEQNKPEDELISANEKAASNNFTENAETTPVVRFGSLYVECVPWAHIYLDDRRLETTPISEPIDLRTGTYTIKLVHPDYPEYTADVEIKPDQKTDLFINLDTLYGFFLCNVFPWADIYLNDEYLGQTPFGEPLKLVPGTHILSIKNPNYPEVVERINIARKDTLVLSYNLNEVSKNKLGSTK